MPQHLILLPVAAQVVLTFAVLVALGFARARSIRIRRQRLQDLALATERDWEMPAVQAANNYRNQFEMPVLFYAVSAFALALRYVDPVFFGLACLFVASRIVHALVHLGGNSVAVRGSAFLVGAVTVGALWVMLCWRVGAAGW